MQKKIIALAVAGLSTAAIAQTNVTIYGVADVSGQGTNLSQGVNPSTKPSGGSFNLKNNSSLIGFKGTESLGNGLNGLFQIETNVNMTGGSAVASSNTSGTAGTTFGQMRDSFVGVSSKYGTVLGGYMSTPYRSALTSFDVMPGATGDGRNENLIGKVGGTSSALASSVRATALAYALPTMYGFNGSIAYTGSTNNGNTEATAATNILRQALSLNLGWSGYGVDIKGAFQQAGIVGNTTNVNALNATTAGTAQAVTTTTINQLSQTDISGYTSYLIGAAYTGVPGLKVAALYNRNTVGLNTATVGTTAANASLTNANKGSNNQYWLGASYRFGNNEPRISWAQTSNTNFNGGTPNDGGRQWTANWGYYLSKRTQVYGLVSGIKNNQNGAWNMASGGSNLTATAGQSVLTYGAGLRTNF